MGAITSLAAMAGGVGVFIASTSVVAPHAPWLDVASGAAFALAFVGLLMALGGWLLVPLARDVPGFAIAVSTLLPVWLAWRAFALEPTWWFGSTGTWAVRLAVPLLAAAWLVVCATSWRPLRKDRLARTVGIGTATRPRTRRSIFLHGLAFAIGFLLFWAGTGAFIIALAPAYDALGDYAEIVLGSFLLVVGIPGSGLGAIMLRAIVSRADDEPDSDAASIERTDRDIAGEPGDNPWLTLRNAIVTGVVLAAGSAVAAILFARLVPLRPPPPTDLAAAVMLEDDLKQIFLAGRDLQGINLRGRDLTGTDFQRADLSNASLIGADLTGANLGNADLTGANFRTADLRNADLSGAELAHADLRDANLMGANLDGASLERADLTGANLSNSSLHSVYLIETNMRDVNLTYADLLNATLASPEMTGADLRGANLAGLFNLTSAKGLGDTTWDEFTRWPRGFEPPGG